MGQSNTKEKEINRKQVCYIKFGIEKKKLESDSELSNMEAIASELGKFNYDALVVTRMPLEYIREQL